MSYLSEIELFNISLIDVEDFIELVMRFAFTLFINYLIVKKIYYARSLRRDYLFTYLLISVIVFFLCILLDNVKLQLGFALGLFAIFGIIRYRTDTMPIKEMTYLFIVIGISVINALANKKVSYIELIFTNLAILGLAWFLESVRFIKHETQKLVKYEKIDLIKPENRDQLLADLEKRTGLTINRVKIEKIDFMTDSALITIFYYNKQEDLNPKI
jgi:hypothetical protein